MGLTLNDVCSAIVDCEHKTAPTQSEGYPSIRTPNIGRGRLILEGVNRVSDETYEQWTQRMQPMAGDLILAREAPIGNVAIVPSGLKVCLGQRTVLIRANRAKVLPEYLVYLMLGDEIQGRIHSQSNGATVHHLNMKDIRGLVLPQLPSVANQRRIASILSVYDDLIENNTRRIAILEEMARRIYEEWFVRFRFPGHEGVRMVESELGLVPEGWVFRPLSDLVDDVRDSVSPDAVAPNTPYVGLEHIPRRSIALAEWGRAADVQSGKLRFRERDILFGKIRPYFHKVAVATVSGVASSDAIVIRSKREADFGMALAVVSSDAFVSHATQTSNGTKMPRANWAVLQQWLVPTPPGPLQSSFASLMGNVVSAVVNHVLRNRNLRTTRDLLLPKLISGELDVSDLPDPESVAA